MKWSCKICNNSRLVIITSFPRESPRKSQKNPKESKKIPNLYYIKWMLNIYRHGRREDALALQWGTCCSCSRWACRSFPRRRPPLWRTWWTGRRWTPWPRPEVEEGNQQGDEGNERNREAHMLTLFWCLVLLWLLAEDEKGRERDTERVTCSLSRLVCWSPSDRSHLCSSAWEAVSPLSPHSVLSRCPECCFRQWPTEIWILSSLLRLGGVCYAGTGTGNCTSSLGVV